MTRVYVYPPVHPFFLAAYLLFSIPVIIMAGSVYVAILLALGIPGWLSRLILYLVAASPLLSFINIHVAELGTGRYRVVLETRYVSFYGIVFPVISPRLVEDKVVVAVNIGGAVVPLIAASAAIAGIASRGPAATILLSIPITLTTLATYWAARPVPHVGIAVPMLIPPLAAALASILVYRDIALVVASSYASAVIGSLLGADILRLRRSVRLFETEYGPAILSIGGAGTFDGIYLSGLMAPVLAALMT